MRTLDEPRATGTADFSYGNARLRARRSRLLTRADYDAMLNTDLDGMLGALAATDYAAEVEVALTRRHGAARVHDAVRHHLAHALEDMRSFYRGRARELVDILLSRWDLSNVLALIRGEATAPHTETALDHTYPMGPLSDAVVRQIARQNEFAAAVQLLVRWQLPDAETAAGLRAALPEYERTGSLPDLENAVTAAWWRRTALSLQRVGRSGARLLELMQREIDDRNLLIGLRLHADLRPGERLDDRLWLPGGTLTPGRLDAALRLPEASAVAAALTADQPRWQRAAERWVASGDLVDVQHQLDTSRVIDAMRLFAVGDPLGIDIPIAYALAKETEARNVRLIAEGTTRGLSRDKVAARLVITDGGQSR